MREKILRATAKIISNQGLEAASTRAICDSVGMTAPTLYYYFKDKTQLLDSVTQLAFDIHRKKKQEIRTGDALSNLKVYWDEYIRFSLEEPELYRSMIVSISQGRIVETGYACFSDLVTEFKDLSTQGVLKHPALQCAQIYLGSAQGIAMILMSLPKTKKLPPLSATTRDVVLSGLLKAT